MSQLLTDPKSMTALNLSPRPLLAAASLLTLLLCRLPEARGQGGYYDSINNKPAAAPKADAGQGYYATIGAPQSDKPPAASSKEDNGYYATIGPAASPRPSDRDGYYSTIPPTKSDTPAGYPAGASPQPSLPASTPANAVAPADPASPAAAGLKPAGTVAPPPRTAAPARMSVSKPTMTTAVSAFNERRYGDALAQFDRLDHSGYCCDTLHYYLARCYQQLSQVAAAQQNYELVLTNSKNPTLRAYSQMAYDQLSHYSQHRTYEGNGNNFSRMRGGWGRGGGGG